MSVQLPPQVGKLVAAVETLTSKLESKPPAWCQAIVRQGEQQKLLSLDTSARSRLGVEVERQLRSLKILCDFDLAENQRPEFMQSEPWEEPSRINPGVMALLDLMCMKRQGNSMLDAAKVDVVIDFLVKKVICIAETICEEITAAKRGLTPLNEKLSRDIMAGSDASAWLASNQLRDAVARNNKDTAELEQGLKGL